MDHNLEVLLAKIIFVHLKEVKYCVDLGYIHICLDTIDSEGVGMGCCPQLLYKACSVSTLAKDITECIN